MALQRRGHRGQRGQRVALSQPLVVAEDEPLALHDRSARVGTELVALEGSLGEAGAVVEEVVGVEDAVALEVVEDAVDVVGSGFLVMMLSTAPEVRPNCVRRTFVPGP